MHYHSVEEAIQLGGLRLVLTRGVPAPWSIAARLMFEIKGIDYVPVAQELNSDNDALKRWIGETSAPAAVLGNDRPRTSWSDIIILAERLAPAPRLIPEAQDLRAEMFGVCHELCAEDGLGWCLRELAFDALAKAENGSLPQFASKYQSGETISHLAKRAAGILNMLDRRLEKSSSGYLVGDSLSAADIYWTTFSNVLKSMSDDLCDMPDYYRALPPMVQPYLNTPLPDRLFEHRDRIVRTYLRMPIRC